MFKITQHNRSKVLVTACTIILSIIGIGTAIASKTPSLRSGEVPSEAQVATQGSIGAVCKDATRQTLCFSSPLEFSKQISSEQYTEVSGYQSKLRADLYNEIILEALDDNFISVDEYIHLRNTYFNFEQYKSKVEYERKLSLIKSELKKELMDIT